MKFRMPFNQLPFQLELQNGHSLVHLHIHPQVFRIVVRIVFDGKHITVGIFISFHGKGYQRYQIDSISVLQCIQIAITGSHPDDRGNTCQMSAGRSHPDHIMVPPLNIHAVIFLQGIQNNVRPRSPVKNIPDNMQMINHQPLNQFAQCDNKSRRTANADNRMDNFIIVGFLVLDFRLFCDQLLDNIRKIFWQCFSDLGAGIFGRNPFSNLNQPVQCDFIPVFDIIFLLHHQFQFFLWIIDQCGKAFFVSAAQSIAKFLINLILHRAGTVF